MKQPRFLLRFRAGNLRARADRLRERALVKVAEARGLRARADEDDEVAARLETKIKERT